MSPAPPAFTRNAEFLAALMNLICASHSARVMNPSLSASLLSKNPFRNVFSLSSRLILPSLSASPSSSSLSKFGILKSLSAGSPGDHPA